MISYIVPDGCVNNKEVYLTVLRAHACAGHLSYIKAWMRIWQTQKSTMHQRRMSIRLVQTRYRLIICDIIYDIPDLGMTSQFLHYDIICDIIKLLMISHIVMYDIRL